MIISHYSSFKKLKSIVRVALYLRLSDEDRNKLTKEELSESIKNQEILLRDFVNEHKDWKVISVYNDDDWSGSDITRPDFNKMIKECECGNIDLVLCKTQSRFARDIELVEKYVHNLFHEWNVRFVTVVDKIDNLKRETKKTSQILSLTDEWYLEDTSLNIRETLKGKRKMGQLTASFSVYGYLKDPENKNHLIIDPITSNVVKRIYDQYLSGNGLKKIASGLNNDKVLSPYEYKLVNGSKLKIPVIKEFLNFNYIEKAGTYIIDVNFNNKEDHILKDLVSFNYITTDMKIFNTKCSIILRKYNSLKTKIYYSEKENLDINNFNEEDCILLNENDIIPKTATVIVAYTKELDRTHLAHYQLEITLKENRNHDKYYVKIIRNNANGILKSEYMSTIRKKFKWSEQSIKKILKDEVYIGNLIQFKSTTVSYKNHTVIHNNEEERIRKNSTHEAIINRDVWYIVQDRLKHKSRSCQNGKIYAFSNKVFCMNCKQVFSKCGKSDKLGFSYLCCKDKKFKWSNCNNRKYLREYELYNLILEKINNLLNRFYDEGILNEMYEIEIEQNLFIDRLYSLEKELQSIDKELQSKNSYFQKLYEDRINEILPEKEFLILLNKYQDDNAKLEERKMIIKREIDFTISKKEALKSRKDIIRKYRHIDDLSIEIIDCFIDKILVGNYDDKTGIRNIKVLWDFMV